MKRTIPTLIVLVALGHSTSSEACSIFTAHDDATVLVGNNEDWYGNYKSILWFTPPEDGKYGYVAWGFEELDHFSQGGMNDQGLFWDALATPALPIENCTGTQPFTLTTLEELLQNAATVEEAIEFLEECYYADMLEEAQFMFVDANGDSAIFEGDQIIYPEDGVDYQIGLNFYWSNPSLGNYPDWRLDVLTAMMEDGLELSVDYFAEMADAAHQGVVSYDGLYTRYTTVSVLGSGEFHLYYNLMWDDPIVFDLAEEFELGPHEYEMHDLFYGDSDTDSDTDGDTDTDTDVDTDSDSDAGVDAGVDPGDDGDCGCATAGVVGSSSLLLALMEILSL